MRSATSCKDRPEPTDAWQAWQVEHGIPEEHWTDASAIIDPDGNGPRIYFQRVPEPKAVKNRLHLDVNAGGPPGTPPPDRRARVDKTVERLAASGATLCYRPHGLWRVLRHHARPGG